MTSSHKPVTRAGKPPRRKHESQESALAGRERKRKASRKGLAPGGRHNPAENKRGSTSGKSQQDPRIGSRKPVPLVVESVKPAKPTKPVATKPKAPVLPPEQELIAIENDERLAMLLDRLDEGLPVSDADQDWVDERLARHQQLMAELGLDEEADDEDESQALEEVEGSDVWSRFMEDEFDPSELDPEYKKKP